jgi:hypothetical protein
LPSQCTANESIVKAWMCDCRRIFLGDDVKQEVKWGDDQESPDPCNPKYNFCELQGGLRMPACSTDIIGGAAAGKYPRMLSSGRASGYLANQYFEVHRVFVSRLSGLPVV